MKFQIRRRILVTHFLVFLAWMTQAQQLTTVSNVDIKKYSGMWYEIASFPQRFQKGCECTTANYTTTNKDYLIVENRCKKKNKNTYIKGKAFVEKNSGNAKLKVQFFWPFKGKYWIIDLDKDYNYAVVSHPNKKYLWILSRKPTLDKTTYDGILTRLKEKGFDLSLLIKTKQI